VRPIPAPNGIASVDSSASFWLTSAAAPLPNASRIPGTKWWTWRPPTRTLPNGFQPRWMPKVDSRIRAKLARKPESMLNRIVSWRGVTS
jgi:hypothetical protein